MKKQIRRIIGTGIISFLLLSNLIISSAHSGNISGWKDKNSEKITKYNDEYYGYHKEDGVTHYHKVTWDDENSKWKIVDPDTYYDENFNITKEPAENESVEVTFVEAVDGDTARFMMDGEKITVRFLAVDTPESVHPSKEVQPYGKEASNFTKEKLSNAEKIILEFDSRSDKKDKYDRYLAWIWVDGELLQELLIKEGLAKVNYIYGQYEHLERIQKVEEEAKNNKVGIWKDEIQEILNSEESNSEEVENIVEEVEEENTNQIDTTENTENSIDDKTITIIFVIAMILSAITTLTKKKNKGKRSKKRR